MAFGIIPTILAHFSNYFLVGIDYLGPRLNRSSRRLMNGSSILTMVSAICYYYGKSGGYLRDNG